MGTRFDNLYTGSPGRYSNFVLFFVILLLYSVIDFLTNYFVLNSGFFFQSLGALFEVDRIGEITKQIRKIQQLRYLIFPVILFCKISFASFCIYITAYISGLNLQARQGFYISLIAEMVFLLAAIVRFAWFLFFPPAGIEELQDFAPLSLYSLYDTRLPPYAVYALQTINLFEAGYCFLLAKGLQFYTGISTVNSIASIVKSYGAGLIVWILFIVFLLVQVA